MKVLVAIDSFKGSFSSAEAATVAIRVFNHYGVQSTGVTLADGGEGTSAVSYTHLTLPTTERV